MERDVAWKKYDEADLEALEHLAAEYIDFISDNKTERECAASAVALAEEHGYLPLDQAVREGRTLKAGETFVVPAGVIHDAHNASNGTVKLIGVYVVEKGKPLATPAP